MRLPPFSLRLRIALVILGLEAILVGGVLFVALRHSLATSRATVAAADRDTTALLEDLGRIALLTDEYANLQSFIEKLGQHSRIRFVAVTDLSGRIMASTDVAGIGKWPVPRSGSGRDAQGAIANGDYPLGWLDVRYSDDGLVTAHHNAYRVGVYLAAVGMLVVAVVGWMIGHLLTRQLTQLAAVADAVSAGDLTPRARLRGNDEVARVGRALDGMVDRLERRLETMRLDRDRLILPTEAINEGFVLWDANERLVRCNRRFQELLGRGAREVAPGTSFEAFLNGPFRAAVADNRLTWPKRIRLILKQHRSHGGGETEREPRDGRWLHVSKSRLPDGSVIAIYTDITEAKKRELALRESEQQLRAIMDSVAEGIIVLDEADRIQTANPTAAAMFGYGVRDLDGLEVDALLEPSGEPAEAGSGGRIGMIGIRRDGSRFPIEVAMGVLFPTSGVRIATIRAVTVQKADRAQILLQATHDALTGLPNRRLFDDRLEVALRRAARSRELVAVAFLDVDRFKTVNDCLGHAKGDRLLVALSERLRACLRDSDTVARMGGDEFIFILPGLRSQADAAEPAQKLLEAARQPVRLDGQELFVTASIGVSVFPDDGRERDLLLRHADAALYRAKSRGRNRFELFDPGLAAQAAARVRLDADLRRASEQNQLQLVYQPQINLRTGKVVGFEALMRWHHPQLGLITPGTFIPIAEESGLISTLGVWALREACRDVTGWDASGMGPLRIAVNVWPRQLQHDDLVGQVRQVLGETDLAGDRLELELTETTLLLEDEAIAGTIARLRALGVRLALDDFGTGYSSLSHLRQYPIQRLKMDRSFVRGVTRDRGDAAVARAIIGLARELRLSVVAEGVETAEQLALLVSFGCEEGQGFHIGRPVPAREVAGVLRLAA